MRNEQGDVDTTLAERGHVEGDALDSIKEIGPEAARTNLALERPERRDDESVLRGVGRTLASIAPRTGSGAVLGKSTLGQRALRPAESVLSPPLRAGTARSTDTV